MSAHPKTRTLGSAMRGSSLLSISGAEAEALGKEVFAHGPKRNLL